MILQTGAFKRFALSLMENKSSLENFQIGHFRTQRSQRVGSLYRKASAAFSASISDVSEAAGVHA